MDLTLRLSLVLEALVVAIAIHLVATGRHPRRLLGVHLGREKNEADLRLSRMVQLGNAIVALAAVAVILTQDPSRAIAALLIGSFASPALLIYGYVRLLKTIDRPQISGRYLVPLEKHTARELVSIPLQLFNLALIAATSLAYLAILPGLPDRMAHELWGILLMMLFQTGMIWFVAWISSSERMALSPSAPEETRELQLMKRQLTVRMIEWIMIGANVSSAVCWLGLALYRESVGAVVLLAIFIATSSIIAPLAMYLQPLMEVGDRLRELGGDALGTRAESWKMGGTIYWAPDDPALFVAKRAGVGTTINFARPGAWLLMLGILAAPLIIALFFVLQASR